MTKHCQLFGVIFADARNLYDRLFVREEPEHERAVVSGDCDWLHFYWLLHFLRWVIDIPAMRKTAIAQATDAIVFVNSMLNFMITFSVCCSATSSDDDAGVLPLPYVAHRARS